MSFIIVYIVYEYLCDGHDMIKYESEIKHDKKKISFNLIQCLLHTK